MGTNGSPGRGGRGKLPLPIRLSMRGRDAAGQERCSGTPKGPPLAAFGHAAASRSGILGSPSTCVDQRKSVASQSRSARAR